LQLGPNDLLVSILGSGLVKIGGCQPPSDPGDCSGKRWFALRAPADRANSSA